jgi:hypothetical protein
MKMSASPIKIKVRPTEKNNDLRSSFFLQLRTNNTILEMIIIVDTIVANLKKGKNTWSMVSRITPIVIPIRIRMLIS